MSIPNWSSVESDPRFATLTPGQKVESFAKWEADKATELAADPTLRPQDVAYFRKKGRLTRNRLSGLPADENADLQAEQETLEELTNLSSGITDRRMVDSDEGFQAMLEAEQDPVRRMMLRGTRPFLQQKEREKFGPAHEQLKNRLIAAGRYGAATMAANTDQDKTIRRAPDGSWDMPVLADTSGFLGSLDSAAALADLKAGQRTTTQMGDHSAQSQIIHDFQQAGNFSDQEVQAAFDDLMKLERTKGREDTLDVLSDGSVVPNWLNPDWMDPEKAKAMIDASGASEEGKKLALQQVEKEKWKVAPKLLQDLEMFTLPSEIAIESPREWGEKHKRSDYGSPNFFKDYYAQVIEPQNAVQDFFNNAAAKTMQGFLKSGNTLAGLGGFLGSDTMAEMGQAGAEASASMSAGSTMDLGLLGSLIEELPSLAIQVLGTKGIGGAAGLAGASQSAATKLALGGSTLMAGAQSAGMTFSSALAEGKTESEARMDALRAGVNTSIITGLFSASGTLGGLESIAAGKSAHAITVGDVLKAAKDNGIKNFVKSPQFRGFASGFLGSVVGEAAEEGLDELGQAFINADPDTSLGDAWSNAVHAAQVGGFIGGSVDMLMERARGPSPQQLHAVGLPQTAQVLQVNRAATVAPSVMPATPAVAPKANSVQVQLGEIPMSLPEDTGAAAMEAVFGKAPKGEEYVPEIKKESFGSVPLPDGRHEITFDNVPTGRVWDPVSGTVGQLPPAPGRVKPAAFTRKVAKPAPETAQEKADGRAAELREEYSARREAKEGNRKGAERDLAHDKGALQKLLTDTDKDSPVSFDDTVETASYDPVSKTTRVNPSAPATKLRVLGLAGARVEKMAVESEADGAKVFSKAGDVEVTQKLREEFPTASDDVLGKMLVARAVRAPGAERDVVASMSADQEVVGEVVGILNHLESDQKSPLGEQAQIMADKARRDLSGRSLNSAPFGSGTTVNEEQPGTYKIDEDEFRKLIKVGEKGGISDHRIDSGAEGEEGTITRPLPVGSTINVVAKDGTETPHVVVATRGKLDGHRSHYLMAIPRDEKGLAEKLRSVSDAPQLAADTLAIIDRIGVAGATHADLAPAIEGLLQGLLGEIMGTEAAEGMLDFQNDGKFMSWERPKQGEEGKVRVNVKAIADSIAFYAAKVGGVNRVTMKGLASHITTSLATKLYEELAHRAATEVVSDSQMVEVALDLVALAQDGDRRAMATVAAAARWQARGNGDESLNDKSDEEVVKEVADKMDDGQLWVIGHEAVAALAQRLASGLSSADADDILNRYVQEIAEMGDGARENDFGKPGLRARLRGLLSRFTQMANEMVNAVSRFLSAHSQVRQLPLRPATALAAITQKLAQGGVKAPDPFRVRERAIQRLSDEMSHASEVIDNDGGLIDVQKQLRDALFKVRDTIGFQRNQVIVPDFATGELKIGVELPEELALPIQESLDAINRSGRVELMIRAAASAREFQQLLDGGHGDKLIGTTPQEGRQLIARVREREEARLLSELGVSEQDLLNMVNERINKLRTEMGQRRFEGEDEVIAGTTKGKALLDDWEKKANLVKKFDDELSQLNARSLELTAERTGLESVLRAPAASIEGVAPEDQGSRYESEAAYQAARSRAEVRVPEIDRELATIADRQAEVRSLFVKSKAYEGVQAARQRVKDFAEAEIAARTSVGKDIERARLNLKRSIEAFDEWKASDLSRPVRSLQDLRRRLNLVTPEQASEVIQKPGLLRALTRADEVIRTVARLQSLPQELEFLVFGGRPPGQRDPGWTPLNTGSLSQQLEALPATGYQMLRNGSDPEQIRMGFQAMADDGFLRFGTGDSRQTTLSFSSQADLDWDRDWDEVVHRVGNVLDQSADNSLRVLGLDPSQQLEGIDSREMGRMLRDNAAAITKQLTEVLHGQYFAADPAVNLLMLQTGGFPALRTLEETRDRNGEVNGQAVVWKINDRAIDLPPFDPPAERPTKLTDMVFDSMGFMGQTLVAIDDFLKTAEANDGSGAVLKTREGLTPAGLAYQLLAPQQLRFLATLKNLPFKDITFDELLAREAEEMVPGYGDRVRAMFAGLPQGVENSSAFERIREAWTKSGDLALVHPRFWTLYRMGGVANRIAREAREGLRGRELLRELSREAGISDDLGGRELPFVPLMLDTFAFDLGIAANVRASYQDANEGTDEILSIVSPLSAVRILDLLDSVEAENAAFRIVEDSGDEFIQRHGDVLGETGSATRTADFAEFQRERELQAEANQRRAQAKRRTVAAMAIFGGNPEAVIRFFNRPEFIQTRGNDISYNTEKIDSVLRRELQRMAAEEREKGVVTEVRGKGQGRSTGTFDKALEQLANQFLYHKDHNLRKASRTLRVVLDQGGEIYRGIPGLHTALDKAVTDDLFDFQNDHQSVMMEVARLVPGISLMQGRVNEDRRQEFEEGGQGRSYPSVVFVPSDKHPLLVMPYRNSREISEDDAVRATAQMVEWLGRNGEVDVEGMARQLLKPIADLADPLQLERKALLHRQLTDLLLKQDESVLPPEVLDAIDLNSSLLAVDTAREAAVELERWGATPAGMSLQGEFFLSPQQASDMLAGKGPQLDNRKAAQVISGFLVVNQLKRVLAHSLLELPAGVTVPDGMRNLVGSFLRTESLPYGSDSLWARFVANLPEGLAFSSEEGGEDRRALPEEGYEERMAAARERLEATQFWDDQQLDSDRQEGDTNGRRSFTSISPLLEQQAENAELLLNQVMAGLQWKRGIKPSGLWQDQPAPGITEMEARQMIGLFSHADLAELAHAPLEPLAPRDGQGGPVEDYTLNDLLEATGEAANAIRAQYTRILTSSDNLRAREAIAHYGSFGLDAYLDSSMPRHNHFREGRIEKGVVAAIQRMSAFDPMEGQYRFDASLDDLQQRLEAAGLPSTTTVLDAEGNEVQVPLVERYRQLYAEQVEGRQNAIQAIDDRVRAVEDELRRIEDTFGRITDIRRKMVDDPDNEAFLARFAGSETAPAEGMTADEELMSMFGEGSLDTPSFGGAPLVAASRIIRTMFSNRDQMVSAVAEALVDKSQGLGALAWIGRKDLRTASLDDEFGMKALSLLSHVNGALHGGVTLERAGRELAAQFDLLKRWRELGAAELDPDGETDDSGHPVGHGRAVDREGYPAWYGKIADKQVLSRLKRHDRTLRRMVNDLNSRISNIAERASDDFFENLVDATDHLLPAREPARLAEMVNSGEAARRIGRLAEKVRNIANPQAVAGEMMSAMTRNIVSELAETGGRGAASAIDMKDTPLEFGEQGEAELAKLLKNETGKSRDGLVKAVREVLDRNLFTPHQRFEQALDHLESKLKTQKEAALTALRDNRGAAQEVIRLADQLAGLDNLSTLEAREVVLNAAKEAMKGARDQHRSELQRLLTRRQEDITKRRWYDESFFAMRNGVPHRVRLQGSPDDKAVAIMVLRDLGERWEAHYQRNRKDPALAEGMEGVEQAANQADLDLTLVKMAEAETGTSWRVADGLLQPENVTERVTAMLAERFKREPTRDEVFLAQEGLKLAAAAPIPPSTGGSRLSGDLFGLNDFENKRATDRVDILMHNFESRTKIYTLRDSRTGALAKSVFNPGNSPMEAVRRYHREMLLFLSRGVTANAFEPGTLNSLHDRADDFLRKFDAEGTFASVSELMKLYAEAQGMIRARIDGDLLRAGYHASTPLHESWTRHFLHESATIRVLFSKALKGQHAAMNAIGLLDYGTDSLSGRNGYLAAEQAMMKGLMEQVEKLPEEHRFRMASEAYMTEAAVSYLQSGKTGTAIERAKTLLDALDTADTNLERELKRRLSGPKGSRLSQLKSWLTEESWQVLQERENHARVTQSLRDTLLKVTGGSLDRVGAIQELRAKLEPESKQYANYLNQLFTYMADSFRAASAIEDDSRSLAGYPTVPFRWQTFGVDARGRAEEKSDLLDLVAMKGAMWRKNPNRSYDPGRIEVLDTNGMRAPVALISDMLYRMNVSPNLRVLEGFLGSAYVSHENGPPQLAMRENREGALVKQSVARGYGEAEALELSGSLSLVAKQLLFHDLHGNPPQNRIQNVGQMLGMLGMTKTLLSGSQIWRQTLPGAATYATALNGGKDFLRDWREHVTDSLAGGKGSGLAKNIDVFIRDHAPYLYIRGADGIDLHMEILEEFRPEGDLEPTDRVTGKERGVAGKARKLVEKAGRKALKGGKKGLEIVMAKPEKILARSIFMNEVLMGVNQRLASGAKPRPPVTLRQLVADPSKFASLIDEGLLAHAMQAANDIMAQSDPSKKAAIFQKARGNFASIVQSMFVTFANHTLSLAANSHAAAHMMVHGDKETKAAARRLLASNLGQNIGYQLLSWRNMTGLLAVMLAAMSDDKDEEKVRQKTLRVLHGDDEGFLNGVMKAVNVAILGGQHGWGYSAGKDAFTDEKSEQNAKDLGSRLAGEMLAQTPFVGLVASTTMGGDVMRGRIGKLMGATYPERAGITPLDGNIDTFWEQSVYNVTKLQKNELDGASYLLIGINEVGEPVYRFSNTPKLTRGSVAWGGAAMLAQLPFVPREATALAWEKYGKETGAKIWAGSWERKSKKK